LESHEPLRASPDGDIIAMMADGLAAAKTMEPP